MHYQENNKHFTAGTEVHGFRIEREEDIAEIRVLARVAVHAKTGASLLHLACDDPENLFWVGFRTPPMIRLGSPIYWNTACWPGPISTLSRMPLTSWPRALFRHS